VALRLPVYRPLCTHVPVRRPNPFSSNQQMSKMRACVILAMLVLVTRVTSRALPSDKSTADSCPENAQFYNTTTSRCECLESLQIVTCEGPHKGQCGRQNGAGRSQRLGCKPCSNSSTDIMNRLSNPPSKEGASPSLLNRSGAGARTRRRATVASLVVVSLLRLLDA
jgi:hypothetical protein